MVWKSCVLIIVLSVISGCRTRPDSSTDALTPDAHLAVAARARALVDAHRETTTPAREFVNRLRDKKYQTWLKWLSGEEPGPSGELSWIAKDVARVCDTIETALAWPEMPRASVPYTPTPPKIDGKLDDEVWLRAWTQSGVYPFNQKSPGGPATSYRMLWDEEALYLAFDCVDVDLQAKDLARDEAVWNDDCVELFLLPQFGFRTYWELIVSASGSIYDAVQCKDLEHWGANLGPGQTIEGLRAGIVLRGTLNNPQDRDDGYSVEIVLPWKAVQPYAYTAPEAGHTLHFMLVRLDRNAPKEGIDPYAFQPLVGWGHNIWNHAVMELQR